MALGNSIKCDNISLLLRGDLLNSPALSFYSINENLVLWARSEIIGSASLNKEFLNPKHA